MHKDIQFYQAGIDTFNEQQVMVNKRQRWFNRVAGIIHRLQKEKAKINGIKLTSNNHIKVT